MHVTNPAAMLDIKTSADYLSRSGTFSNFSMLFAGKHRKNTFVFIIITFENSILLILFLFEKEM